MKAKSISAMLLAVVMTATAFTGCGVQPESSTSESKAESSAAGDSSGSEASTAENSSAEDQLTYADGTVLRMACGYNSDKTGMSFTADLAGEGITLADGKTYNSGDLKPTWQAVEELLKIKIEDKYQGNKAADEYQYWDAQLDQVDMISGTATLLSENG